MPGSGAQSIGIHGWGMVGVSAASGGAGAAIAGGKAEDILFGIVQGAMVATLNHFNTELQERRYVQKIINKMIETKCVASYKDIFDGLSNLNEQHTQFSAVVNIGGEKVRVGIIIVVNEKYLNDKIEYVTTVQYEARNLSFSGENESFIRNGNWDKLTFNRSNPNNFKGYYKAPFEIHYSSKYNDLIYINLLKQ